jgi:hypothetical protein
MDTTTTTINSTTNPAVNASGLEDVVRSARAIARTARNLGEDSANLVEREMAMAIKISNQLLDDVISKESLEEARHQPLAAKLRQDAHDTVSLMADVGSVLFLTATRFLENFADEPRSQKQAAWYSIKTEVHHDNAECRTGNNIEIENRRPGTGGKPLCKECARLDAQTAQSQH